MLEFIILAAAIIWFRRQLLALSAAEPSLAAKNTATGALLPRRQSPRLASLIDYADRLYAEKKWHAAEKAYLGVLKLDHKHVNAYVHLGIIYSTQKNFADAIECFQITVRLKPSAITHQNLALAYYENHNYMKAIATFEKSIMFEPTAARYQALARAYRKISDIEHALTALERAADLDPSLRTLQTLAEAYAEAKRPERAAAIYARMQELGSTEPRPATPAAKVAH